MIMGIDPGWSGGVAVVSDRQAIAYGFTKMTERDMYEAIKSCAPGVDMCYIEKVHSMPKQGVASSFKFGHSYGFLRGVLTALNIPFTEVSPMKWQNALSCRTGGDKNITKAKAQQLYPSIKITHAIADALLIATYGFNQQNGGLLI